MSRLMMKKERFDRHDRFVDRGDGVGERWYVIEFYAGEDKSGGNGVEKGLMSRLFSGRSNRIRPLQHTLLGLQTCTLIFVCTYGGTHRLEV